MKKAFKLLSIVFLLMIGATTVLATTDSFTGKQIQGETPLFLNGNEFSNSAIIVDGVSFIPVREVSEKLGLEVKYDEGQIFLNSADDADFDNSMIPNDSNSDNSDISDRVEYLNKMIEDMGKIIATTLREISDLEKDKLMFESSSETTKANNIDIIIESKRNTLKIQEKTLADLESQLEQLLNK